MSVWGTSMPTDEEKMIAKHTVSHICLGSSNGLPSCSAICTDIQVTLPLRTPKPPKALLVFVDRRNDGQTSVRRLECEMAWEDEWKRRIGSSVGPILSAITMGSKTQTPQEQCAFVV
jgi:hypothetical protein